MFRFWAVAFGLLLLLPANTFAAKVEECSPWVGGKSPPVQESSDVAAQLANMVDGLDECSDERVVMSVGYDYTQYIQRGKTRACASKSDPEKYKADHDKYGCKPGQIQAKVCVELPTVRIKGIRGGKYEISKCDKTGMKSAIHAVGESGDTRAVESLSARYAAGQSVAQAGPNKGAALAPAAGVVLNKALEGTAIKDPEVRAKVEGDPIMRELIAKGANPADIDNRLKDLGVPEADRTTLTQKIAALTPGTQDDDTKNTEREPNKEKGDCLVSTNPIWVVPGKYGPGCVNYGWRENTGFNQPYQGNRADNSNRPTSSGSPFGGFESLLKGLMGNSQGSPFGMGKKNAQNTQGQNTQPQQPVSQQPYQQGGPLLVSDILSGNVPLGSVDLQTTLLTPILTILAQKKEVRAGDPIIVSWSSLRALKDPPCIVATKGAAGDKEIAKANGGTRKVETESGMSGSATFTLRCLSIMKEPAYATTTVTIK